MTSKLAGACLFEEAEQPWESLTAGFAPGPPLPGMMCSHELKFLHYLARTQCDGSGSIVDLGPLFGSSTYALASGGSAARVFSYDLWQCFPSAAALMPDAGFRPGDDLLPYFRKNVDRFRDRVVVRKGDIACQRWSDGPIRILFIDAAKSPKLMRHIAGEFFPHLVPGSYVVHQDWVSAEDPWIHIAMGILAGHFEIMDAPEVGTVCFRVKRQIPAKILRRGFLRDPHAASYLASARAALPGWHGLCVWLAQAHHCVLMGDLAAAKAIVSEVARDSLFNEAQVGYDLDLVNRAIANAGRSWIRRLLP
jgi:hypothetical protein